MTAPDPSATPPQPPYPGFGAALLLLALLVVSGMALTVLVLVFDQTFGTTYSKHPALEPTVYLVSAGVVIGFGLRRAGAPVRTVLPFTTFPITLLVPMALTVLGLGVVLSEADNVLRMLMPPPPWIEQMFEDLFSGKRGLIWSLLLVVVAAPAAEEMLFRGLILHGFLGRYPFRVAVFASAMLFAFIHLNPWQFFGALAWGVVAAWWFARTGSLWPCIFGHALNNGMPFVVQYLIKAEIPGYTTGLSSPVQFQPLWFDAVGVLVGMVGIGWLIAAFHRMAYPHAEPSPG